MSEQERKTPAASVADALWRLYKMDVSTGPRGATSAEAERATLAAQVGGKLMSRYRYNRDIKREPVTQLQDSVCPACGTHYAPSHMMAQLAGTGEVRGCFTCGRLLTFVMNPGNLAGGPGGDNGTGPTWVA